MKLERWGWGSVAVSVVLALLHAVVASFSGSLAVVAELTHNLVDLLSAIAVLIGLKLATRKTAAFPYGLYKVENVVAAALALLVLLSAYEIARDAILAPASRVRVDVWMLGVLAVTLTLPIVFSRYELRAGRAANSPALIADATEYRVHVATTGLVFVALLSEALGVPLDRVAALPIVVVVARTGWNLLRDAMRALLDASLDPETLLAIRKAIDADPAVGEVRWVSARSAGRFRFVEAGVALRAATLARAEEIVRRIEASVRRAVPYVERVLVQVETAASPRARYAVPLADREGTLSEHFGEAPFFALALIRRGDGGIEEQHLLTNPHRTLEKAKGLRVAEWLVAQKVDVLLMRADVHGKGPEYVLRDAGVAVRRTEARTLSEVLARP